MANLPQVIQHLYPASVPLRDWVVSNPGSGQVLSYWNDALGPRPTAEALAAAELPAAKAARIAAINAECKARITSAWPLEKQISALAGVYGQASKDAVTSLIAGHIDASNTASDAVTAAATVQDVEAVTVAWPV